MLDRLGPLSARLDDKLFLGKERRRECSAADGREEADERGNSNMMSAEVASERMPKKRHVSSKEAVKNLIFLLTSYVNVPRHLFVRGYPSVKTG